MRAPASWLREYCDPPLSNAELGHRLAMSGIEVERIDPVGVPVGDGFVVGKVIKAEQHPDADRLRVCEVDDGGREPRTIVCGAPNVATGQTVAVARPGAIMPDGSQLGEAKLRGVVSSGMILAEDEIGLGEDHSGTMMLDDAAPAGAPLADHLPISDEALELETSPNRPDTLGVYGLAREVHAVTSAPLAEDPTATDAEASGDDKAEDHASIEIEDADVCLRFTARVFEEVTIGPSPAWLKARLSAAGQRPISNVVDITNYVMLATGQPLHAFDLGRVRGAKLVVRRAREGEKMTTLDGVERSFDAETALVYDAEGPSGIAGVMGGEVSEVSQATTRILMEVATWVGPNILRTSSELALRSEASARFEKQLHPDQAIAAQRMASKLMVELCGARLVPGTLDAYPQPSAPRVVSARPGRIGKLLGAEVPGEEVEAILGRLGFGVEHDGDALSVSVPSWRDGDVQREADVIEEVARIHGVDRLPTTLPARRRAVGRLTPSQLLRRRLEDALRDRGLFEVVAFSFTAPATIERLGLDPAACVAIANPLSEEQSVMRPLLLPGLLDVARDNAAHGQSRLALFESAHVYRPGDAAVAAPGEQASPQGAEPAVERHHLAALLVGTTAPGWRTASAPVDFYAAKAVLEGVLSTAGVEWSVAPAERPFLHPGRSAALSVEGRDAGFLGELHPRLAGEWGLGGAGREPAVAAFELDFDLLAQAAGGAAIYAAISSFPPVAEDIAVVVGEEQSAEAVLAAVREGGAELLHSVELFDVYRGEQVGEGRKSLALRLEFRAPGRTLTDDEVAQRRTAIEESLAGVGGQLRA